MVLIGFYVPVSHSEKVKMAMFDAGAGKLGNYDQCSFEYQGIGQFRSLPGSDPFIGRVFELEKVNELKVEMMCKKEFLKAAIIALRATHPYEMPAFYVTDVVGLEE